MPSTPASTIENLTRPLYNRVLSWRLWFKNQAVFGLGLGRQWLFIITALGLYALAWSSWILIHNPYSGVTWSLTNGMVLAIDPSYPHAGSFRIGDQIISIDGEPVYQARNLPGRKVGGTAVFIIERQGKRELIKITLDQPHMPEIEKRMASIPIALSFWLLGTIVLAYGRSDSLVHLFFLFCQMTTILLGLGAVSSHAPKLGWWLFGLLLWWIGPLMYHTHMALSASDGKRINTRFLSGLYGLSLLFSVVDLVRLNLEISGPLLTFKYLWVGGFMLASAGHIFVTSLKNPSAEHRRRTRIAGISAVAAFLPFVLFSLLPDALTGKYTLPYEVTLFALPILPLGYTYAILSYRLIQVEREISRSAANALAVFALVILYAFVYVTFSNVYPSDDPRHTTLQLVMVLLMAFAAHPIHQVLYRWVFQSFYGGWFDDRVAVKRIFQDLKDVQGDTHSIAKTLCQTLQRTMWLEEVNLLLSDGSLISIVKGGPPASRALALNAKEVADLFDTLQVKTGRELGSGEDLKHFLLDERAEDWPRLGPLLGQRPQLWLLFGGSRNWQGLLVLGPKRGRADFDTKDLEILEVVLRQAGAALENERLLEEVSQRSRQITDLSRKMMWTREVERKRIARDIHDMVIQNLVGINFQLSHARARNDPQIADELGAIRESLQASLIELRGICADLRPTALDTLGLVPAIQARITEIKSQVSFEIMLKITGLAEYDIPDQLALCIYRFIQEALLNIQKHSRANVAMVYLQADTNGWLELLIEDDGQGFEPPARLEMLVAQQHFGLIGLREQVEAVGGSMDIESETGKGCRLMARIPLRQE